MSLEFLRRLPLFAGLPEADLEKLCNMTQDVTIPAGEMLMVEGTPGDSLYVVLEGEFEILKKSGKQDLVIAVRGAGEVMGEISLLDEAPRSASVRALRDSTLMCISRDSFHQLLASSASAATAILHTVSARLRNTESMLRQSEKMAALGTLSAGLAHELNNPAAAVQRSASQLGQAVAEWQRWSLELTSLGNDEQRNRTVAELREEMPARAARPVQLDPLARSDEESELEEWLENLGVEQAWELAPALVSFGYNRPALSAWDGQLAVPQLAVLVQWLAAGSLVYSLLGEVGAAAERLSEIVKAVKSYSYLDQAPVQEVDIRDGLENTLVILRHKLKNGIRVIREYSKDVPRIDAYGSELNQVWTNIIDNAVDAMNGQGELLLRTYPEDDHVVVEIVDSGPGIPEGIQERIFEPFFTTKPPGVGTGLGLHISYNIIVNKHHGRISVDSKPGATCFKVELPVQL